MNPLPNRPLLNNSSMPLSLPNVPSFDQIAYHRPRKVLPEASKDFPMLNGHPLITGPSSAPINGPQSALSERNNTLGQPQPSAGSSLQPNVIPVQSSSIPPQGDKEKEDSEGRQLTAIFRPDDAGDWKEKLRLSHEASEQARFAREGQGGSADGANAWDRQREDEEEVKDEDTEVEDDDSTVVSDGEETKIWKAKRTFRKLVKPCQSQMAYLPCRQSPGCRTSPRVPSH